MGGVSIVKSSDEAFNLKLCKRDIFAIAVREVSKFKSKFGASNLRHVKHALVNLSFLHGIPECSNNSSIANLRASLLAQHTTLLLILNR